MRLVQNILELRRGQSIAALRTDIEDEMEFHIQSRADELLLTGMSAADALKLANTWMKASWPKHFDALIFNRQMSPSSR